MKFIMRYKLTIISVILILIAILMPSSDIPSVGIPNIDKVVHFGMFGFLSICFYGEYYWYKKELPRFLYAWPVLELFAGSTEMMQLLAEGRGCDVKDFIADSFGILTAIVVAYCIKKYIIDKTKN